MRLSPDQVVAGLVARGVPAHVAQGVAMNFQDESGLDTGINERNPIAGRGGFGLAQWTGPRRVALDDFARSQGKSIDDPNVQLDFFMNENAGPEKGAWNAVVNAPDAKTAAASFVKNWERPTSQHVAERTAKYMGDSPSEVSGARFGGTGLGQPGIAPATPLPPAAPAVEPTKTDLSGSLEALAGGGKTTPLPTSTIPRMGTQLTMAQPTQVGDVSTPEQMRAQLAQRIAMLNSGRLF